MTIIFQKVMAMMIVDLIQKLNPNFFQNLAQDFQKLDFHENNFNLTPFPVVIHNLMISSIEIECDP